ncbi:MAG TPA: lipopolysaccharide biosynthesis protein, partial [Gemmatimonadaceae bacterium]|nr:lipopolysaccharide biosynthesis protein [Gemmatimonadaceae bacterium]
WRYSAGMAASAVGAIVLANADRLALTVLSTPEELGRYTIAFTATGLLQLGIQPFYKAFFPRYAELISRGDTALLREEYFRSCRVLAAIVIPAGTIGIAFAPEILRVWVGSTDHTTALVLRLLLSAITMTGVLWLPAAFQQAHGWTRLHAAMIAVALLAGFPVMVWAIQQWGTVGATAVWMLHGTLGITMELWLMHRRLLPGDLKRWYTSVLLPPLAVALPIVVGLRLLLPHPITHWASISHVAIATSISLPLSVILTTKRATTSASRPSEWHR